MPIFQGSICSKKAVMFALTSIISSIVIIYLAGKMGGLISATLVMMLSLIIVWYSIGKYGDVLFHNNQILRTEKDIDENKDKEFNFKYK